MCVNWLVIVPAPQQEERAGTLRMGDSFFTPHSTRGATSGCQQPLNAPLCNSAQLPELRVRSALAYETHWACAWGYLTTNTYNFIIICTLFAVSHLLTVQNKLLMQSVPDPLFPLRSWYPGYTLAVFRVNLKCLLSGMCPGWSEWWLPFS